MTETDNKQQRERAMVIVAHPDDADFLAAGTVAKWAREGVAVTLVVVTDGSKGTDDPEMDPERLVRLRQTEQRSASQQLGVSEVVFLGYEDGVLEDTQALRRDLTRLIRQYRPDWAICMDPTVRWSGQGYINHPDHIAAASATLAAIFPLARNRGSYRELLAEGLEPHKVTHVLLGGTAVPDHWVDISETIDLKVQALKQHISQIDTHDVESMVREWARSAAEGHGMGYAEAYKYFKLA